MGEEVVVSYINESLPLHQRRRILQQVTTSTLDRGFRV